MRRERREAKDAEMQALRELAAARKAEVEAMRRKETPTETVPEKPVYQAPVFDKPRPRSDDFEDYAQYEDARDAWLSEKAEHNAYHKAKAEIEESRRRQEAESHLASYNTWKRQGMEKYQDFEQVITSSGNVPEVMSQAVREANNSHEVAYYLGKNPQEFQRIASLSPIKQAMEVAQISVTLASKTVKPKTIPNAAPPITPVTPKATPNVSLADMSMDDFIAYRNEQEFGRRET